MRGGSLLVGFGLSVACSGSPSPSSAIPDDAATTPVSASSAAASTPTEDASSDPPVVAATPSIAEIGQTAPDFTLPDLDGKPHRLSAYQGSWVVLEWFNPKCPFVKFAHEQGPLVDMAEQQTGQGVVWLAINSGGPGRQGHGVKATRKGADRFGMEHPILLDERGTIGHLYDAVKTPQVYLIDPEGILRYAGAIDNAPFGEVDGDAAHRNHLAEAIREARSGTPISAPTTPAYGCTVKYARE